MNHDWLVSTLADVGSYAEKNELDWLVPMMTKAHEAAVLKLSLVPAEGHSKPSNVVYFPLKRNSPLP